MMDTKRICAITKVKEYLSMDRKNIGMKSIQNIGKMLRTMQMKKGEIKQK